MQLGQAGLLIFNIRSVATSLTCYKLIIILFFVFCILYSILSIFCFCILCFLFLFLYFVAPILFYEFYKLITISLDFCKKNLFKGLLIHLANLIFNKGFSQQKGTNLFCRRQLWSCWQANLIFDCSSEM